MNITIVIEEFTFYTFKYIIFIVSIIKILQNLL